MSADPLVLQNYSVAAGARLFANRSCLVQSLHNARGGIIAEIGVAFGGFSRFLLESLNPRRLDVFDLFMLHRVPVIWGRSTAEVFGERSHLSYYKELFQREIASGQLEIHEGDSSAKLNEGRPETYDVIYVDGAHDETGVERDAQACLRTIKRDGVLVFHSYTTAPGFGVVHVVNNLCVNHGWKIDAFSLEPNMFCDVAISRTDTGPA